jgi:hypothetical protein
MVGLGAALTGRSGLAYRILEKQNGRTMNAPIPKKTRFICDEFCFSRILVVCAAGQLTVFQGGPSRTGGEAAKNLGGGACAYRSFANGEIRVESPGLLW